jgi:hypothetical protein
MSLTRASASVIKTEEIVGTRNRIINGAMEIDQRNAGASVTINSNQYTLDRWQAVQSQTGKYSVQQNAGSVTPPVGFTNYLGVTSLTAHTLSSADFLYVRQQVEGYNIADFALGTANASTFTLSFWVRSSLTGTFGGTFSNGESNSVYPFTYTINTANTWEQKSITVTGRTSGTWNTTNGTGMYVLFALGTGTTYSGTAGAWTSSLILGVTGQTNVLGTNGATWQITGVQLEKGSTATPFERRQFGTELALCQRYYYRVGSSNQFRTLAFGQVNGSGEAHFGIPFPVIMRTRPTVLETTGTPGNYRVNSADANFDATALTYRAETSESLAIVRVNVTSGLTGGYSASLLTNTGVTNGFLAWSSEL